MNLLAYAPPERRATDRPTTLLALGDPLFRLGLARLLVEEGIEVLAYLGPGEQALELAHRLAPDVVIVDSNTADVSRFAALESAPSVLMLAGTGAREGPIDALGAGAAAYLAKESGVAVIASAIRAAAAGQLLIPAHVADAVLGPVGNGRRPLAARRFESELLSERETEVLQLTALGMGNREIAEDLVITQSTVKNHLTSIMGKLGARNRTEAVMLATRDGYL